MRKREDHNFLRLPAVDDVIREPRSGSPPERGKLNEAFALNRRLFKAYFLKKEIERLWRYT